MPQPIDFQTEVARTLAADRIQEIAGRASLAAQQRAGTAAEEDRVRIETQVKETPETQTDHVDPETKRRNPFAGRRKRRERGPGDSTPAHGAGYSTQDAVEEEDGDEGHKLDVTV